MPVTASAPKLIERRTYCSVCEASCGMIATLDDGHLIKMRPDPQHPNSRGFACPKGVAWPQVLDDPDRVTRPLQRQADGSFEPVGWDEALDDIGARLRGIIDEHGSDAIGIYAGNPTGWNYAGFLWSFGFAAMLKSPHMYIAGSLDINNYWVVGQLLYGSTLANPVPDFRHTHFQLILGANPVVSHGSMVCVGDAREMLLDIPRRGGRVVVVDPRRSETAKLFEHLPIRPDGDAWLIAAMLKVIFDEGLEDRAALAKQTRGVDALRAALRDVDMLRVARETGIAIEVIEQLARDFAAAPSASAYGRCGTSLGRFATLSKYLVDVLNIVTGNLDRRGGFVFTTPMVETDRVVRWMGMSGYNRWKTRVDQFPEVMNTSPVASLPREIETPGKGQLRAMLICSGNIATTGPAAGAIDAALPKLELLVSLDPYITETNRHAHYILPPTLALEREGIPIFTQMHSERPYAQWDPPLATPRGEARDDWWIIDQISRRLGRVPSPAPGAQLLGKLGIRLKPATVIDLLLRIGPQGDWFGLRKGVSRKKLWAAQAPIAHADELPVGVLRHQVPGGRIALDQPVVFAELARMLSEPSVDAEWPLRIISLRELRSQNSWLHNVPKLMSGHERVQRLYIHPQDAGDAGVEDGQEITISSRHGRVVAVARLSDDMMPGTVALPQGWAHRGGWKRAVAAGGAAYNLLTPNRPEDVDRPSGNAVYNGVAVRVEPRVVSPSTAYRQGEVA